eukprot:TRINITY_DN1244_c0_g1_i5.p2 TRINITY_DN1244_c0_g1~~TRINITY_DN1244_c0_g1_i5.p2  ORF type:complete len:125 (+),score=24.63 TRINITY_DN1244_c0_g1_i5:104-478(+)
MPIINIVNFHFGHLLLTILEGAYYAFFVVLLVLSLRESEWVKEYFGIVRYKLGRGLLIILLALFFSRNAVKTAYQSTKWLVYVVGAITGAAGVGVFICSCKEGEHEEFAARRLIENEGVKTNTS